MLFLEYKLDRKGLRICSFPQCRTRQELLDYHHHRLCQTHYDFMCLWDAGQNPPLCQVPMCYKVSHLVIHEGRLICQKHYRQLSRLRTYDEPETCYLDTCPQRATSELKGKLFCHEHYTKLKSMTEPPVPHPDECNYVGCRNHWTVSGFNSHWCPQHYLEMCRIREVIRHDNSETDLAARLKEIKVRKDSSTETGMRHRWYYLQTLLSTLAK